MTSKTPEGVSSILAINAEMIPKTPKGFQKWSMMERLWRSKA
jgi:hypothetical protein